MPKIYLSPSGQQFNEYLSGGNEEYFANLIADGMQPYLAASGVDYGRNSKWMSAAQSAAVSNAVDYDGYIAVHSNAMPAGLQGRRRGCDVYYFASSAESRRFAELAAENMRAVYPDPALVRTVPSSGLIELKNSRAPAILVETAYHDNAEDEAWIKDEINNIAAALADACARFVGAAPADPPEYILGTVVTQGGALNLRRLPDADSEILSRFADGSRVRLYGKCGLWYAVSDGAASGFSAAAYIIPDGQ